MAEDAPRDGNFVPTTLFQIDGAARGQLMAGQIDQATGRILMDNAGGSGTVTNFAFTDANGFHGVVTNATTTPTLTLSNTVNGIVKSDGTSMTAASSSTDYAAVAFKTFSVSGQSDVVADSPIDTLTLVAGANITITTDAATDTITFAVAGVGTGDVVGPASATDNAIVRFDGTTGKLIQNSAATVADTTGDITAGKYNGLTITTSTGTLTITNLKTLSVSNTLTFTGTDGSSVNFGAGGTVLYTTSAIPLTVGTTTIASGTNGYVLYDNSGVLGEIQKATTATASTLAQRDSNANTFSNDFVVNSTSTATAGGTTTLTVASSPVQVFTGSSSQTLVLPDATTLTNGKRFWVNNNSSGTITIKDGGGTTIYTAPAGGYCQVNLLTNGSAAGTWDIHPLAPSTVTWSSGSTGLVFNTALTTTPTILSGASSATSPAFVPQRGASTTGFGGDGTNVHAIVGGATSTTFNSTGLTVGTSGVITTGTIELGAASDTTISRSSAGVIAVEGIVVDTISAANTLTNKTLTSPTIQTSPVFASGTSIKLTVASSDGTATGLTTNEFNSGYSSSAVGDLVYLDSSATWQKADADLSAAAYSSMLGIALEVKASGNALNVLLQGFVYAATPFPTFTIGAPIYMSATAGAVTQTAPTTTDSATRIVGYAVHADKMWFNPSNDWITHI